MALPTPTCRALGPNCRSLRVTLRVSTLDNGPTSGDHEATWLLGHTGAISFGRLRRADDDLLVDAVLHVPCRHLTPDGDGGARCRVHGFEGSTPEDRPNPRPPRRLGSDRFELVERGRMVERRLAPARPAERALPVLERAGPNPCATAPCRTADHTRGAACCRDLQVEIMCSRRAVQLEALIRARKPPYLCKVDREGDDSLEAEVISRCAYLDDDEVSCALHGRLRPDDRPAKPDLCTDWPGRDASFHPGCVFAPGRSVPNKSRTQG